MFKRTTLIILWALVVHGPIHAEEPVYFAVEQTLGVTDPTASDMLGLTNLYASWRGISDLTGLEYATNLTWLDLNHNQISDLSPLAGLTNLTQLGLWSNQISDLSPLLAG